MNISHFVRRFGVGVGVRTGAGNGLGSNCHFPRLSLVSSSSTSEYKVRKGAGTGPGTGAACLYSQCTAPTPSPIAAHGGYGAIRPLSPSMPCRANRCHGAAAALMQAPPSLSCPSAAYIWINDDLLAQAFSRFSSRVIWTAKRHGSSVPGPLEARRRLARRRMVGLANHGGAPMPDFGSLFGTGSGTGSVDVGSLWKPPSNDSSRSSR